MFFQKKGERLKIVPLKFFYKAALSFYKLALLIARKFLKKDEQLRYSKKYEQYELYTKQISHYSEVLKLLKIKQKRKEKIRVGFLVMFESVFSAQSLYDEMLKDDLFDLFIVIIPDILRPKKHMYECLKNSFSLLSEKYRNVFMGYDFSTDECIDFSEKMDITYIDSPYDCITHEFFRVSYLKNKDILLFHLPYGYMLTQYSRKVFASDEYSYFWKVFIETKEQIKELKQFQGMKGRNAVVSGYGKMDYLAKQTIKQRHQKVIILAPHHSLEVNTIISLSNFLRFSSFFLKLPVLYPNIKFIFRPHPLLLTTLRKKEFWGYAKTDQYLQSITSFNNVYYSHHEQYFDAFVNSDAMIHDCASFLGEYLITGHPVCYLLRNNEQIQEMWGETGQKCLHHCYKAFDDKDIICFIDNVVIKGDDRMKNERISFSNKVLKVNYPNVGKFILNNIKESLM